MKTNHLSKLTRYVVGIDLGTTNSAVAFIDLKGDSSRVETFTIPQLTAPATVERLNTLPSFHYHPARGEFTDEGLALPWSDGERQPLVGALARDHGAAVPGRVVVSAKSWLCHSGVDRTSALLPWHGESNIKRHSPSEISGRYLEHIRKAWDHDYPKAPLAKQNLVLTVPASFDEVARELTLAAARDAGLSNLCLIEEPQAAFYAWMNTASAQEKEKLKPGQIILVCDIGGGTTDLTLIRVEPDLSYRRIAVGDHLILGGDNLDLALAHYLEARIGEEKLSPAAWSILVRRCQQAKEALLHPDAPESYAINLPVRGSRIVGGTRQLVLSRDEVTRLLVDGFLPPVTLADRPQTRSSGFQEFGLPYAPDAAITRYLAAFLVEHVEQVGHVDFGAVRPDHILFNGGFFMSPVLRERMVSELKSLLNSKGDWQPSVLDNPQLDLAVAHGAVHYGLVRLGKGARIAGGLARTYYLGVGHADPAEPPQAVCLLPAGLDEGASITLTERMFQLLICQPVEFPLYTSTTRLQDHPGDLVAVNDDALRPMPSLKTVVQSGRNRSAETVEVQLHASLTEVGTIELWCAESGGRKRTWQLEFDVRTAARGDVVPAGQPVGEVDDSVLDGSLVVLNRVLGPERGTEPNRLVKELELATGMPRDIWPPALLRTWVEPLMALEPSRPRDAETESRWFNMLGYALRPGYGFSIDDWRISQLWPLFAEEVAHHRNEMCRAEWWILWRRIAGGLNDSQQQKLAASLIEAWTARIQNDPDKKPEKMKTFQFGDHESAESWRVLGSLERLRPSAKEKLGTLMLQWVSRKGCRISNGAAVWALGRVGARVPTYGPLNSVIASDVVELWIMELLRQPADHPEMSFALMQMSRKTNDRYRDVSEEIREKVLDWMRVNGTPEHHLELVRHGGVLDEEEQNHTFGEALPPGLHMNG